MDARGKEALFAEVTITVAWSLPRDRNRKLGVLIV
jgi:hypothetical protein